jgi:hypothetical protein
VRGGRHLIHAACHSWDRSVRWNSEYQFRHNGETDISRHHAERAEKITRTDKQTQQAAKQDEKAARRHTEKEKNHTIKSRPEEQATQHI